MSRDHFFPGSRREHVLKLRQPPASRDPEAARFEELLAALDVPWELLGEAAPRSAWFIYTDFGPIIAFLNRGWAVLFQEIHALSGHPDEGPYLRRLLRAHNGSLGPARYEISTGEEHEEVISVRASLELGGLDVSELEVALLSVIACLARIAPAQYPETPPVPAEELIALPGESVPGAESGHPAPESRQGRRIDL